MFLLPSLSSSLLRVYPVQSPGLKLELARTHIANLSGVDKIEENKPEGIIIGNVGGRAGAGGGLTTRTSLL